MPTTRSRTRGLGAKLMGPLLTFRRSMKKKSRLIWRNLPPEIQFMVFEELVGMERANQHIAAKCSTVCSPWQRHFEAYCWQSLVLTQSDLPQFRAALQNAYWDRLSVTEYIVLRIKLDEYDCSACKTVEDEDTIKRNCITFTNAVWEMLEILAMARPKCNLTPRGLDLVISVFSPSDHKHVFKPFSLQDDYAYHKEERHVYDDDYEPLRARLVKEHLTHDPSHGWSEGSFSLPDPAALHRLYGSKPLEFDFSEIPRRGKKLKGIDLDRRLPKAPIVRSFTVRRNTFRSFSATVLFKLLHEAFPKIERLQMEQWQKVSHEKHKKYTQEFRIFLKYQGLPTTLKKVAFLQDHSIEQGLVSESWWLAGDLSRASRHLEKLSIAHFADSPSFFDDYRDEHSEGMELDPLPRTLTMWPNLRSLSVTSRRLSTNTPSREIETLLGMACTAARHMPQLEDMTIWTCGHGEMVAFEFVDAKKTEGRASLKWRTSSGSHPNITVSECFDRWRQLGKERDPKKREPEVSTQFYPDIADLLNSPLGYLAYARHPAFAISGGIEEVTRFELQWECFHNADPKWWVGTSQDTDSMSDDSDGS